MSKLRKSIGHLHIQNFENLTLHDNYTSTECTCVLLQLSNSYFNSNIIYGGKNIVISNHLDKSIKESSFVERANKEHNLLGHSQCLMDLHAKEQDNQERNKTYIIKI